MLLKEQISDHAAVEVALEVEFRHRGVRRCRKTTEGFSLCVVHEKPVLFMKSQVRPG